MWRKLGGYSFLSVLSFCVCTVALHTWAGTQTVPHHSPDTHAQASVFTHTTAFIQSSSSPIHTPSLLRSVSPLPTRLAAMQSATVEVITSIPTTKPSPTPTSIPPTTTPIPTAVPSPTLVPQPTIAVVSDLESMFTKYSDEYHVSKDDLKRVAKCESGFNSQAANGPYIGMYQFMEQTWISARTTMQMDTNPELRKNAEEAIRTAAFMFSNGQGHAWSGCL